LHNFFFWDKLIFAILLVDLSKTEGPAGLAKGEGRGNKGGL
jgi:hypothetical protein